MKPFFHISLHKNNPVSLNGIRLIAICEQAYNKIISILETSQEKAAHDKKFEECVIKKQPYKITEIYQWGLLPQLLRKNAQEKRASTVRIAIDTGTPIDVVGAVERIVKFPNNTNSYQDITTTLLQISTAVNLSSQELSDNLLKRILLLNIDERLNEHLYFIDSLIILLMGVEPSRHFPTFFYSFMLLKLMVTDCKYNINNVFVSGKKYVYDDYEKKDFGGKFPMACNSTGAGNLKSLNVFIKPNNDNYHEDLQTVLSNHQHHAVAIRGMTLIINWLESLSPPCMDYLSFAADENDLCRRIEKLLLRFMCDNIFTALKIFKPYCIGPPTIDYQPILNKNSDIANELTKLSLTSRNLSSSDEVVRYTHSGGRVADSSRFFHHKDNWCKLTPEYVTHKRKKTITFRDSTKTVTAQKTISSLQELDHEIYRPCNYCYRVGSQSRTSSFLAEIDSEPPAQADSLRANIYYSVWRNIIAYGIKPIDDLTDINFEELIEYFLNWYIISKANISWSHKKAPLLAQLINNICRFFKLSIKEEENKPYYLPLIENLLKFFQGKGAGIFNQKEYYENALELYNSAIELASCDMLIDRSANNKTNLSQGDLISPVISMRIVSRKDGFAIENILHDVTLVGPHPPRLTGYSTTHIACAIPDLYYSASEYDGYLRLLCADILRLSLIHSDARLTTTEQQENFSRLLKGPDNKLVDYLLVYTDVIFSDFYTNTTLKVIDYFMRRQGQLSRKTPLITGSYLVKNTLECIQKLSLFEPPSAVTTTIVSSIF